MSKKKILMNIGLILIIIGLFAFYRSSHALTIKESLDRLTLSRINEIRSTGNTDISGIMGNVYYVSNDGDDNNDGLSVSSPIKTVSRLNSLMNNKTIKNGDAVLFRRGDIFRGTNVSIKDHNITFGSYGNETLNKPKIYGSAYNYAENKKWVEVTTNVWLLTEDGTTPVKFKYDVGGVWFFCNKGNKNCTRTTTDGNTNYNFGAKKMSYSNVEETQDLVVNVLRNDLDFYHMGHASNASAVGGALYVYSTKDPSKRFDDIEISLGVNGFGVGSYSNIVIDNINISFFGRHGIGSGSIANLKVTNSELSYIGGMVQRYDAEAYWPLRFGNAIEVYGNVADTSSYKVGEGYIAENNYIYEVYDAGLTFQYTSSVGKSAVMEKATFNNNVVENCSYNIEYWNSPNSEGTQDDNDKSYINKAYMTNNILRYAGIGFTETRPEHGYEALIKTWDGSQEAHNRIKEGGEFIIENNIFDTTGSLMNNKGEMVGTWMLHITASSLGSMPTIRNNKFYNYRDKNLGYVYSNDTYRGLIPYNEQLKYNDSLLKDNDFYVYDAIIEPTNILNGVSKDTTWTLDLKKKTLTISGTGKMSDYSLDNPAPWSEYADYIKTITIEKDVTYLGKYAFYGCFYVQYLNLNATNMTALASSNNAFSYLGKKSTGVILTIGKNVEVIPAYFTNPSYSGTTAPFIRKVIIESNKLSTIEKYGLSYLYADYLIIPEGVTSVGDAALSQSSALKLVVFPDSLTTINKEVLKNCKNLEVVIFGKNTETILSNALKGLGKLHTIVIPNSSFTFPTEYDVLDIMSYRGLSVYGPDSMEELINSVNELIEGAKITFIKLKYYRPIIYGDQKTFYAIFDDAHYGDNTTYKAYALSNSDVSVTGANYRFYDRFGHKHLIDGVNISLGESKINHMIMDVELKANTYNKDEKIMDNSDILFLGNSLLSGFSKHGMASTRVGEDYYHYVMQYLKSLNEDAIGYKYTANAWETATTTEGRYNEVTNMFTSYNSKIKSKENVGVVFIQLGDNINNDEKRATFREDLDSLMKRFKEEYPNAKIYMIYGRYNASSNIATIKEASLNNNIDFIDVTILTKGGRYDSYIGASYLNYADHWQKVVDPGVAAHPGNYGFIAMSDIIINKLKTDLGRYVEITSNKYDVNNKVIIASPSSLSYLKSELDKNITSTDDYEIYVNDVPLTDTSLVGTGATIRVGKFTYKIIILGDVTGDGKISLGDISKVYNHYKNKIVLTDEFLEAGKVTRKNNISLGDISKLYNFYKRAINSL